MTPRTSHVAPTDAALFWHIHFLHVSRAGTLTVRREQERAPCPMGKGESLENHEVPLFINFFFSA